MLEALKNEPLLTAITALVAAAIALLVAFGVDVTDDQKIAIGGFVVALYVLVGVVRSKVTPTRKLDE